MNLTRIFGEIPPVARTLVVFIAGAVIGAVVQALLVAIILPVPPLLVILVFICLALIAFMLDQVRRDGAELRRRVGVKISYLDRHHEGRAAIFARARDIVENARRFIWVLNSAIVEARAEPIMTEDSEATKREKRRVIEERDKYYDALLRCPMRNVAYERILQVREGHTVAELTKDEGYDKHFRKLVDLRNKRPELELGLLKASAKRLSTFVLVDDASLIWQIHELLPSGEIQLEGVFIIDDPGHEITVHFHRFFEEARRNGAVVKSDELPTAPAAAEVGRA